MPTKQFFISGTKDDPATNGTGEYSTLLGEGATGWHATEATRESIISTPGKFTNFQVGVRVAPGAGKSWTFTIRKTNEDTSLSVTISDTAVLSTLDSDEVTVAAGDKVCIKAIGTETPTAAAAVYWTCQFTPDTDGETILLANTSGSALTTNTFYHTLIGGKLPDTTEFDAQTLFPTIGALKKFYVELATAPGNGNSRIFTIQKNGEATGLVVTISGAATTGNDTDPAHNVAIAAGDKVTIISTVGETPAYSLAKFGICFLPDTQGEYIASATSDNVTSTTAIEYQHLNCGTSFLTATEAEQHCLAQATIAKKIYVNLATAPNNTYSWVFTLREALGDTALTVTISNTDTSGNAAVDEAIAADALVDTKIDATAGYATSKTQIAYLFYNAPTAGGTTVTPGTLTQTITEYIPVLQLKIVGASPTANTLTTFNAVTGYGYVPSTASMAMTKYAPVLGLGITPSTLTQTISKYAPVLREVLTPTTLSLSDTEYIPILKEVLTPSTLSLTITSYISVLKEVTTPGTLSLSLTSYVPVLKEVLTPTTLSLNTTGYVPVIGMAIIPLLASLVTTGYAPILKEILTPSTLSLSTMGYAPVLREVLTPTTLSLSLTGYIPVLNTSIMIGLLGLVLTGYAPTLGEEAPFRHAWGIIFG